MAKVTQLNGSLFICVQREESLRVQLKNLAEELDSQRNLHRTTLKRANEAETQLKENQERVTGLEGELLTSDVERDQLKDDKRKVCPSILCRLQIVPQLYL